MNASKNILRLIYGQGIRKSSSYPVTSRYGTLKKEQFKFAIDDGFPVHYKTGFIDKFLVQTTWLCALSGTTWGLVTFAKLVLGKKD
ncbi:uncharacterized protein LOC143195192 isoform X2 [Rhynchophorus ferrugineus]|uniref:Uncharacterized protein n=1 Tax=Rhynchophorus ferrugineus TaxID=354439 RepID=A0A834IJG7_RHYFE|nr:hypothetical protein GWI33_005287 [Rhynchophorus ferrugineus]